MAHRTLVAAARMRAVLETSERLRDSVRLQHIRFFFSQAKLRKTVKLTSLLHVITLQTYTFFTPSTPWCHGLCECFFGSLVWPLEIVIELEMRRILCTDPMEMPTLEAKCSALIRRSSKTTFSTRSIMFIRSVGARPRLSWFVVTGRSAFFQLSHPRTQIGHISDTITTCLTQLALNFNWFHTTQMEKTNDYRLV